MKPANTGAGSCREDPEEGQDMLSFVTNATHMRPAVDNGLLSMNPCSGVVHKRRLLKLFRALSPMYKVGHHL